jgi:hypothetical protein
MPIVRHEVLTLENVELQVEHGQVPVVAEDGQVIRLMDGQPKTQPGVVIRARVRDVAVADGMPTLRTVQLTLTEAEKGELVEALTRGIEIASAIPDVPEPR